MVVIAQLYDGKSSVVFNYEPGLEQRIAVKIQTSEWAPKTDPLFNTSIDVVASEGQIGKTEHIDLEYIPGQLIGEHSTNTYGKMHVQGQSETLPELLPVIERLIAEGDSKLAKSYIQRTSDSSHQKVTEQEALAVVRYSKNVLTDLVRYMHHKFEETLVA